MSRVFTETAAPIVSTMHGFNRLIKGDMWKTGTAKEKADYRLSISFGVNSIFFDNVHVNKKTYALVGFDLTYGYLLNASGHSCLETDFVFFHRNAVYEKYPFTGQCDSSIKTFYSFAF